MHALVAKIWPDKVVQWCADGEFLAILCPAFPASCVQHVSDLHTKFALEPHHVLKMADIQSATAEIRRGKKKERKKEEETTGQKYNGEPYSRGP